MKRVLIVLMCLCVALMSVSVLAEAPDESAPQGAAVWQLIELENGEYDLDGDGTNETVTFATDVDEYGDGLFTISVNDFVYEQTCCGLEPVLYAMCVGNENYYYGTLLMVSEYGPSDDHYTYMTFYTNETLYTVGEIGALATEFSVDSTGMITTTVRANMIGTWFRPADFILANGYEWMEDGDGYYQYYRIVEVPRDIYPLGMIVTMNMDLPVYASSFDTAPSAVLYAGEQVVLTATDDVSRLYITSMTGETKGWVSIGATEEYYHCVYVDGKAVFMDDVFANILYAD